MRILRAKRLVVCPKEGGQPSPKKRQKKTHEEREHFLMDSTSNDKNEFAQNIEIKAANQLLIPKSHVRNKDFRVVHNNTFA